MEGERPAGRIEEEIARLEQRLRLRRETAHDAEDLEMIRSLRRILLTLREEHRRIMETLDRAISALDPCPSPETAPILDSLVKRVQVAVGSDSVGRDGFGPADDAPPAVTAVLGRSAPLPAYATLSPEMSLSTYDYLCKYNLLDSSPVPASPADAALRRRRPPLSPLNATAAGPHRSHPHHLHLHQRPHPHPSQQRSKILDEHVIKRMPKL